MTSRWTTTRDVARYLGVAQKTVGEWIRSGRLLAGRVPRHYSDMRPRQGPGRWRIHEDDLSAFLLAFRGDGRIPPGLLRDR